MTIIKQGQLVDFFCISFLSDGTCLDDEESLETIQMKAGEKKSNLFYSYIAKNLVGLKLAETKTIEIPFLSAFGKYETRKIYQIPKEPQKKYIVGDDLKFRVFKQGKNHYIEGTILEVHDNRVEIDTNHPLAGEDIVVKIKIEKIH